MPHGASVMKLELGVIQSVLQSNSWAFHLRLFEPSLAVAAIYKRIVEHFHLM